MASLDDDYPALPRDLAGRKKRKRSYENDLRRLEELAKGVIHFKPLRLDGEGMGAAGSLGTTDALVIKEGPGKKKKTRMDRGEGDDEQTAAHLARKELESQKGGGAGRVGAGVQRKRKKKQRQQEDGTTIAAVEKGEGEGIPMGKDWAEAGPQAQGKKKKRRKGKDGNAGKEGDMPQVEGHVRPRPDSASQGKKKKRGKDKDGHTEKEGDVPQLEGHVRPPRNSMSQRKKKKHAEDVVALRNRAGPQGQDGMEEGFALEGASGRLPGAVESGKSQVAAPSHLEQLPSHLPAAVVPRKSKNKFLAHTSRDGVRFATTKREPPRHHDEVREIVRSSDSPHTTLARGKNNTANGVDDRSTRAASLHGPHPGPAPAHKDVPTPPQTGRKPLPQQGGAPGLAAADLGSGAHPAPSVPPVAAVSVVAEVSLESISAAEKRSRKRLKRGRDLNRDSAGKHAGIKRDSNATQKDPREGSCSGVLGASPHDKPPEKVLARRANAVLQHLMQGGTAQGNDPTTASGTPAVPVSPRSPDGVSAAREARGVHDVKGVAKNTKAGHAGPAITPAEPREPGVGDKQDPGRTGEVRHKPGRRGENMQNGPGKAIAAGKGRDRSLLGQMQQQLQGGFFRYLNEQLYTTDGESALEMMQAQPQLYEEYHKGFRKQTEGWPLQPVDAAIRWLKRQDPGLTVADFGCGDARLAASVPQAVHSLDLVAGAPGVIACNMAHTPLGTASVDVAVFCLALMGTDYPSFLKEAARVLRSGGTLWIAEVRSRFAGNDGTENPGPFLQALRSLGFVPSQQDMSNTMFVIFVLEKKGKAGHKSDSTAWPTLKPCIYKRR